MTADVLRVWTEHDGRVLRLQLARPPANLIDRQMITALAEALAAHLPERALSAVVLSADGPHFSYGASVPEHLPDQCAAMLGGFHALLKTMLAAPVLLIAAVHGRCLGGGLELVLACGRIVVAPDAVLGQPEVKLGVFAPAGSCLLPQRVGQARALDLLCTGRTVDAGAALQLGLADAVVAEPVAAAMQYLERDVLTQSGAALRHAVTAVRGDYARSMAGRLDALERDYLEGLMRTHDAVEGLQAFMAKRSPQWLHR